MGYLPYQLVSRISSINRSTNFGDAKPRNCDHQDDITFLNVQGSQPKPSLFGVSNEKHAKKIDSFYTAQTLATADFRWFIKVP